MMQEDGVITNPYPGLRPFEPEENHLFFGRDGQSNELLRRLRRRRFLAVVGPSGSGKSSLVRAGLLPDLHSGMMAGRGSHWRVALFRPGGNPIGNLARALCRPGVLTEAEDDDEDPMALAFMTITLQRSAVGLVEAVRQAGLPEHNNVLVVVDQFEELFRFKEAASEGNAADQAAAFVKLLLAAADQKDAPIYVIITMRSDFLGDCAQFRDLPEAINEGQYLVPRMTRAERRKAITGPAAVGGAALTPRLVQRLLNDVGDNPDQLPILQHALMRTWDHWLARHRDGEPVDLPDYEAIGSMADALSRHADEAFDELGEGPKQQLAERLFKFVTEKGQDNRETRRPAALARLAAAVDAPEEEASAVIDVFRKPGRSFLMPPAKETLTADSLIDISHESLIRQWTMLRRWVDDEARSAGMYRRLAERAVDHEAGTEGVLTDPQLQLALDWRDEDQPTAAWAGRYDPDPAHPRFDLAMTYLERSEHERQKKARRERRVKITLSVITLIALGATIIATWSYVDATEQTRLANSVRLASQALNVQDSQFSRGQALSVEALETADTYAARSGLLMTLQRRYVGEVNAIFQGHQAAEWDVAFSPDGKTLASASEDNTIILWDVERRQPLDQPLHEHRAAVYSVAFSPDGKTLASAGADSTVILWEVATRQPLDQPLRGHRAAVRSVAFSPDGKTLASAGDDRTVILWDVEQRQAVDTLRGHQAGVESVAFSPDGKTLASASSDQTVILWDVEQRQALGQPLRGHQAGVNSVAFSPNGKTLASASGDNTILFWDVEQRQALGQPLRGHQAAVESVAFSPDGKTLASASEDNTIILWDVAMRQALGALSEHHSNVTGVAFSPDGKTLASASSDQTVILWDVEEHPVLGQPLRGHQATVWYVAFSPDGKTLASASDDSTVILWDVAERQALGQPLRGHQATVTSVAFSPDGKTLASTSEDNTIILWDVAMRQAVDTLQGHQAAVNSVAFSPDGKTLASASADRTVIFWDVEERQAVDTLRGHQAGVNSVAFTPDGKTLASTSEDKTVILWDVAMRQAVDTLQGHQAAVESVAFSPDGKTLASASDDNTIILWDVAMRQAMGALTGHQNTVWSVTFSPDGKTLATASEDNTIILWDVKTHQALGQPLRRHQAAVWSAAFSPDGKTLASASADSTVILWDVALKAWKDLACRRANRNLTQEEWHDYIHEDEDYHCTCDNHPPGAGTGLAACP